MLMTECAAVKSCYGECLAKPGGRARHPRALLAMGGMMKFGAQKKAAKTLIFNVDLELAINSNPFGSPATWGLAKLGV